jgi:hypothetical protein
VLKIKVTTPTFHLCQREYIYRYLSGGALSQSIQAEYDSMSTDIDIFVPLFIYKYIV